MITSRRCRPLGKGNVALAPNSSRGYQPFLSVFEQRIFYKAPPLPSPQILANYEGRVKTTIWNIAFTKMAIARMKYGRLHFPSGLAASGWSCPATRARQSPRSTSGP